MPITTMSSREFNQDTGRAKHAASAGPVIITDRGKPAHVLLNFAEYRRLRGGRRDIAEALAMSTAAAIDFEPEAVVIEIEPADLS